MIEMLTPEEERSLKALIADGGSRWEGGGSSPQQNSLKSKGLVTIERWGACCDFVEVAGHGEEGL